MGCLFMDAAVFERICEGPVAGIGGAAAGEITVQPSFSMLLMGGFALVYGSPGAIGWLANPAAALACMAYFISEPVWARSLAAVAVTLSATSLHATNFMFLAGDEGPVCRSSALAPLPGFWLWVASFVVLMLATLLVRDSPLSSKQKLP